MKKNKGFTLIELLVVIAILALLSTMGVVALGSARAKARDSKRMADVKQIQTALEMYYSDANGYPAVASTSGSISYNGIAYMTVTPTNPSPYDGSLCTGSLGYYTYATTGSAPFTTYTLSFCLGAAVGNIAAGPHNAMPGGIAP